ncbi:MAG: flagellar basal-body rod protein FlgF [Thermosediminibacterales bacterium]|nr:flagellar basal-body rod protein FlgF [Thermosediminibacterales bacterium]
MIRGLYTAASGMIAQMQRTDVISNNLANINTCGFKKDLTVFREYPKKSIFRINDPEEQPPAGRVCSTPFIGSLGTGTQLDEVYTLHNQGQLRETKNPLDLALRGEGFFAVMTEQGLMLTRDGSFSMDAEGFLVTKDGHQVMGEKGPIFIEGSEIKINENGEIRVDSYYVDKLMVLDVPEKSRLQKVGDNLYSVTESSGETYPANPHVLQGYVELANVNSVKEMINLITAMRAYEAGQRVIKTHDQTLEKTVNEIARI